MSETSEIELIKSLDRIDLKIIYTLLLENKLSPLQSLSLNDLVIYSKLQISYSSFKRRLLYKLLPLEFVEEGYKEGRAKTYYLTDKGRKYFENNILDKEKDAFEIIEINEEDE